MGKPIYEMSLIDLVMLMQETDNQELKNRIIMKITYRQYVPFKDKTFEEMLVENGHKVIDKDKKVPHNHFSFF